MAMAASLVVLALLGADKDPALAPASPPAPAAPTAALECGDEISCQMQMTTVSGLGWRSVAYPRLNSVGQKGSSMIWTADRSLKAYLDSVGDAKSSSVKAPRVTCLKDATATVVQRGPFQYIGDVERIADGPINGATQVKFSPKVAMIEVGFASEHTARRIDQGVLARIKVAETHIGTVHRIGMTEVFHPEQDETSSALSEAGRKLFQTFVRGDAPTISAPVMVPEVASSEVAGEWLVPNDSILIVSMGIDTVINAEGKAITQERLAIYDFARPSDVERTAQSAVATARPFKELVTYEVASPPKATADAPAAMTPACRVDADKSAALASVNVAGLSMPRVPDRSFPEAVDGNGEVFDLPPLPEAYASADLDRIKPGTPLASPQSAVPSVASARPIADPQLARTSLQPIPDSEIENGNAPTGSAILTALGDGPTSNRDQPGATPRSGVPEAVALGTMVESFLRSGMASAPEKCDGPACPASGCPFSAEGCDDPNRATAPAPAKVEMGVSVRDAQGTCVFNAEEDLVAALRTPGKAEVKYVPLGGNLSLQIEAKVVTSPAAQPARTAAQAAPSTNR